MTFSFTKLPGSAVRLEVELNPDDFQEYWQSAFDTALAAVHLKGFRPGQAPPLLARRAVDQEKVFQQAAQEAVRYSLHEAVGKNGWTLIDQPKVTLHAGEQGLKYTAEIVIFPDVQIGDYKGIAKRHFSDLKSRQAALGVSAAEIDAAFNWLKKSGADISNFKDTAEMKASIGEGLLMEKKERQRDKERLRVLEEIVAGAIIDIPQIMIDRSRQKGMTDEEARRKVARHLVIYTIARLEELNPTAAEVEERLRAHLADGRPRPGAAVDNHQLYDYIYGIIQSEKVFSFLEKL